jgi:hypothetical protein
MKYLVRTRNRVMKRNARVIPKCFLANADLTKNLFSNYSVVEHRDGLVKTARWFLQISGRTQRCERMDEDETEDVRG